MGGSPSPLSSSVPLVPGPDVVVAVESLSHVRLFVTPRTAARQAPLSSTNSQTLLKIMSHGQRSLAGYTVHGVAKKSDTT